MAQHIQSEAEFHAILADAGDKLVVIDFFATWYVPCKIVEPIFETMVSEYPSVIFLKVDVELWPGVVSFCGVSLCPTFVVYKNTTRIKELSGFRTDKLKRVINYLK